MKPYGKGDRDVDVTRARVGQKKTWRVGKKAARRKGEKEKGKPEPGDQ